MQVRGLNQLRQSRRFGGRVGLAPELAMIRVVLGGIVINVHSVRALETHHGHALVVGPRFPVKPFHDAALWERGEVRHVDLITALGCLDALGCGRQRVWDAQCGNALEFRDAAKRVMEPGGGGSRNPNPSRPPAEISNVEQVAFPGGTLGRPLAFRVQLQIVHDRYWTFRLLEDQGESARPR